MVRKRGLYVGLAIIVAILIPFVDSIAFNSFIQNGVLNFSRNNILKLQSFWLFPELQELTKERDLLLMERVSVEDLERENEVLRRQLGITSAKNDILVDARLFNFQRNALVSTATIDKGKSDGIEEGMFIIAGGNILAGRITEVFENSSRVIFVDDPRSNISARVLNTNLLVESRGSTGGKIDINLVAHTEDVEIDNLIVTSGMDEYPAELMIGKIKEIEQEQKELFRVIRGVILFEPVVNPLVYIIK